MSAVLTILAGLLVIVSETVLLRVFGVLVHVPELAVALVVYVACRRNFAVGAACTLIFAAVADLCWGGPRGYYAFGLTLIFFLASLLHLWGTPRRAVSLALWVIPATWLTDAFALLSIAIFRRESPPFNALVTIAPITALLTAAVALPIFWIALRVERSVEVRRSRAVTLSTGPR
ncbi:MAG: hypothetical protein JW797_16525 [Bradymonadales bacterium]|nr:hypothetical protein [Bradymonadales bacterium]